MATKKKQKAVSVILAVILALMFSGFTIDEDPENTVDIKNKSITLSYMDKSYMLQLEEFCNVNTENQNIDVNEDVLAEKIKEVALQINKQPVDAEIINDKAFQIKKEVDGTALDEAQLVISIEDYITSGNILETYTIPAPVMVIKPEVTEEILNLIKNTEISSFTTKFYPSQKDRTENLRLSTEALNGTVINPGEVFSMDETLGDRTVQKGYKYAPIFSGGRVEKGLAGGICQTTTTMFNAALFANLQIVERYKHGLPVSYINKGRDATIARNVYDLKVKNNTEYPVYVKSYIDKKKGMLTVKIYGYKKENSVKVTTQHQYKGGKNYYSTYRYVYDLNNKFIRKELILTDVFN